MKDKIISTQKREINDELSGLPFEFTSQLIERDGKMIVETSIQPLFEMVLFNGNLISSFRSVNLFTC